MAKYDIQDLRVRQFKDFDVIVCIDDDTLGIPLGGCRMKPYDEIDDAIEDASKLASMMTMKNALAGLNVGGGKTVINLRNPEARQDALKAFAEMLRDELKNKYITGCDVGTYDDDMRYIESIARHGAYYNGISNGAPVDLADLTALGVYSAMDAALKERFSFNERNKLVIFVEGYGKVGKGLVRKLYQNEISATVLVHDIYDGFEEELRKEYPRGDSFRPYREGDIFNVYAPCAMGGTVNLDLIENNEYLNVICGASNNQINESEEEDVIRAMMDYNIDYIPDFLANAGGAITVATEMKALYEKQTVTKNILEKEVEKIGDRTTNILDLAEANSLSPFYMAKYDAEVRIRFAAKDQNLSRKLYCIMSNKQYGAFEEIGQKIKDMFMKKSS